MTSERAGQWARGLFVVNIQLVWWLRDGERQQSQDNGVMMALVFVLVWGCWPVRPLDVLGDASGPAVCRGR